MWRCKLTVAFVLVLSAGTGLAAGPEYTITNLGALPGNNLWGFQLWGINNKGQVVGNHSDIDSNVRAYLWTAGGGMQDLAGPGVSYSVAYSINDNGQIAGYTKSGAAALDDWGRRSDPRRPWQHRDVPQQQWASRGDVQS